LQAEFEKAKLIEPQLMEAKRQLQVLLECETKPNQSPASAAFQSTAGHGSIPKFGDPGSTPAVPEACRFPDFGAK